MMKENQLKLRINLKLQFIKLKILLKMIGLNNIQLINRQIILNKKLLSYKIKFMNNQIQILSMICTKSFIKIFKRLKSEENNQKKDKE